VVEVLIISLLRSLLGYAFPILHYELKFGFLLRFLAVLLSLSIFYIFSTPEDQWIRVIGVLFSVIFAIPLTIYLLQKFLPKEY